MMTITALVTLKEGSEPEWDEAMRQRFDAAQSHEGWIGGQLCMPTDRLDQRLIVGTWRTRADWEAWHNDPTFTATRERLEGLQSEPTDLRWHEVLVSEDAEE